MDALEIEAIKANIAVVLEGFDKNIFVRDVSRDHERDWLIRIVPYIGALANLRRWLDEGE